MSYWDNCEYWPAKKARRGHIELKIIIAVFFGMFVVSVLYAAGITLHFYFSQIIGNPSAEAAASSYSTLMVLIVIDLVFLPTGILFTRSLINQYRTVSAKLAIAMSGDDNGSSSDVSSNYPPSPSSLNTNNLMDVEKQKPLFSIKGNLRFLLSWLAAIIVMLVLEIIIIYIVFPKVLFISTSDMEVQFVVLVSILILVFLAHPPRTRFYENYFRVPVFFVFGRGRVIPYSSIVSFPTISPDNGIPQLRKTHFAVVASLEDGRRILFTFPRRIKAAANARDSGYLDLEAWLKGKAPDRARQELPTGSGGGSG